jgi:hypothetical protein
MKFHLLDPASDFRWDELDKFEDRTVFQTRPWINFLAETQNGAPVFAELRQDGAVLGYFTGLVIRRMGIRMLGSSFPGWTTPYIGFNLLPGVSRWRALEALEAFAFGDLKCLHMEISDRFFSTEDGARLGFACGSYDSYETDLTLSEEELFQNMNSACRRCIRKAEKSGLRIEETQDPAFAHVYYEQLKDVFAKQNLVPSYGLERVEKLVEHLLPTGRLLLLRALDPNGSCIGTGIYPAMNQVAEFWGNASFRAGQQLRPNESLHWYAMRYWKQRGVQIFDWGGRGDYKEKYGVKAVSIPWFQKSRYRLLGSLRTEAKRLFDLRQRVLGRMQAARGAPQPQEVTE